jgi:hypothetical protein
VTPQWLHEQLAAIAEEYEPDTERLRAKVAALIEDRAVLLPATAEEKAPRRKPIRRPNRWLGRRRQDS